MAKETGNRLINPKSRFVSSVKKTIGFAALGFQVMVSPMLISCTKIESAITTVLSSNKEQLNSELMNASESGDLAKVKELLDKGADVNVKTEYGWTPLITACGEGNKEIAALLIHKGANIHARTYNGLTPLMLACDAANKEIVKMLIDKGADVNAKDIYGNTVLMSAFPVGMKIRGNKPVVEQHKAHDEQKRLIAELLISKGADIRARNKYGDTVLMEAAHRGHIETVKLLIKLGLDVNSENYDGKTAIIVAVPKKDVIELLITNGADVNARSKSHGTALTASTYKGNMELVKYLINQGANLELKDWREITPLTLAIERRHFDIAKYLVSKGADVNTRYPNGPTLLSVITNYNMPGMEEFLKKHGAKQSFAE